MYFISLFYPTYFILKILFSSTMTAFLICKLDNKPFFSPELYSHDYLVRHKMGIVTNVGKQVILFYNIIYFTLSQYYLHEKSLDFHERLFQTVKFVFLL